MDFIATPRIHKTTRKITTARIPNDDAIPDGEQFEELDVGVDVGVTVGVGVGVGVFLLQADNGCFPMRSPSPLILEKEFASGLELTKLSFGDGDHR